MRKFYSYIVAAILMAGFIGAQSNVLMGQTPTLGIYKQTKFNSTNNSKGVQDYTSSWSNTTNSFTVNIQNANNNNNGWNYIKMGRKNNASTGTIITSSAIDKPVSSVTIRISAITTNNITSISLYKSTDGSNWGSAVGTFDKSMGLKSVEIQSPTKDLYYKIEAVCTSGSSNGLISIDSIQYNVQTFTVTYDCAGGTGGPTSPEAAFIGSYTIGTAPTRDDYSFQGWNDGTTTYAAGAAYTISSAVTFTAQWQALSSPNIVINDGTPIALAKGASGAQTATVAYNNMSGYSSPSVALFNNSGCTEPFTGDWFSASLSGEGSTTLNYSANANTVGERTVYIKVSATYNEATIYSVLAATQATSTRTVTYYANGGSGTTTDSNSPYNYGTAVNAVNNAFTAPSGKYFTNWSTTASGSGTSYDEGDEITDNITSDIKLYARWADLPTYTLVTDASQIIPGAHYVLASSKSSGSANAMGAQNGKIRDRIETSITVNDRDNDGIDDIYIVDAGLYEFVISGYTNNYTIYDESNTTPGYLYHNGDKDVKVKTSLDNTAKWKLTFSNDAVTITNVNATSYSLQYNSSSPRYTTYSSGQVKPFLYIKDNDSNCKIYSSTILSKDESYTNLVVDKGVVTIPTDKTLTVTGILTNNEIADSLVIADGGQLITKNAVNATVQRHIDAYDPSADPTNGWYFIASPVSYDPDGTNLLSHTYDLFLYDEENVMWRNYNQSGTYYHFTMQPKQGYLYANSEDVNLSFAGQMPASNTTNVTVDLSYTSTASPAGFNLVGNPFTCNVSGFKLKDGSNVDPLTTYYVVEGGTEIVTSTDPIKPGQGFLVQATAENQQLVFNYAAAKGETVTKPAFVRIEAGNDAFMDRAFVQIGQGNTLRKMKLNENVAHVWLMQDGKDYAAASIAEACGEMPVNFRAAKDGEYTLTVNAENVEMNYLHLIDNLTGADVDLLATPSYTFNARTTDYASRFRLVFGANDENGASTSSATFAYVSNGQVVVNGTGILQVVDMLGRIVASQEVTTANCQLSTANYKTGVYVLRLVNNGDVKTQKMVIE